MKVTMVGTGYVGLVTGACLAEVGCSVTCIDTDVGKVERLRAGELPIYEPGLGDVVTRTVARNGLRFSTDLGEELRGSDAVFIAVGTPSGGDGVADLSQVEAVARTVGRHLDHYTVVITKSTVPVGTADMVRAAIADELALRGADVEFDVASNPEFLKEGAAIADFMRPDRIVIGVESDRAKAVLSQIYRPFVLNGHPLLFMDIASAEVTKYAANAMLAMRISFMNLMARLCEETGADVGDVRRGIGSDPRIGSQFLYAGIGYGGSCFPKDVRALISSGESFGLPMEMLRATEAVNEAQKLVPVRRVEALLGGLAGRKVAVWGLAFKPNTDDIRDAPAISISCALADAGAEVVVYDPVVTVMGARIIGDRCVFAASAYEALDDADALVLATEWPEFRAPDVEEMAKRMRGRVVVDGRNVLDAEALRAHGFHYSGIGLGRVEPACPAS